MLLRLLTALALMGSAGATSLERITAYNAVHGQGSGNPLQGACKGPRGDYRLPRDAVAVSRDLLGAYPCGTRVRVRAGGRVYVGVVADVTHRRFWRTVDIRMASRSGALRFGVKTGSITRL